MTFSPYPLTDLSIQCIMFEYKLKKLCVLKATRLRWAGHVARMEDGRSAFKILTGKPTGKRPLGRPRRR